MNRRICSTFLCLSLLFSCGSDEPPLAPTQLPVTDNGDGTYSYGNIKLKKDAKGTYYVDGTSNVPPPKSVNGVTILTPAEAKQLKEKQRLKNDLKAAAEKPEKLKKSRERTIQLIDPKTPKVKPEEKKEVRIDPLEEFRKSNPQLFDQERESARQQTLAKLRAEAEKVHSRQVETPRRASPDALLPPQYLALKQRASEGDPESQYQLGVALKNGLGGEIDRVKAREWLEKAARLGHVQARLVLNSRW
ncbi:MAG: Sel1 repeat [Verrucomicrobiota bacterium]|jgi:hypothetical protein